MLQFPLNVTRKRVREVYGRDAFFVFLPLCGFVQQGTAVDPAIRRFACVPRRMS